MRALSNVQILRILKRNNVFINGIYNKDMVPRKLKKGWYIINMEDHGGDGTHWCCFYFSKSSERFYFDPFGIRPPCLVSELIQPCVVNYVELQDINSDSCGWWCLALIAWFKNTTPTVAEYSNFITRFRTEDQEYNERRLEKAFKTR